MGTIYARVPDELKERVADYAQTHALTVTGAAAELIGKALAFSDKETSVTELQNQLNETTSKTHVLEAELRKAESELASLHALAQRAARVIGHCSHCNEDFTGFDLLGSGICPHCKKSLPQIIEDKPNDGKEAETDRVDRKELLMLLGALGAVLAIANLSK
jgi:Zn finger protein HypA/HybF involved in hydrogenase expression